MVGHRQIFDINFNLKKNPKILSSLALTRLSTRYLKTSLVNIVMALGPAIFSARQPSTMPTFRSRFSARTLDAELDEVIPRLS